MFISLYTNLKYCLYWCLGCLSIWNKLHQKRMGIMHVTIKSIVRDFKVLWNWDTRLLMSQRASTSLLFMPNLRRQRWNTLEAERHANQRRTEIPQVFLFQSVVDVPKACLNFLCWGEDSLFTAAKKREPSCDIDAVIKWCQFKQGCGFVCLKKSANMCKSSNVAWNVCSFQALMTCIAWKATWSNMVKSGPTQPHSSTSFTLAAWCQSRIPVAKPSPAPQAGWFCSTIWTAGCFRLPLAIA